MAENIQSYTLANEGIDLTSDASLSPDVEKLRDPDELLGSSGEAPYYITESHRRNKWSIGFVNELSTTQVFAILFLCVLIFSIARKTLWRLNRAANIPAEPASASQLPKFDEVLKEAPKHVGYMQPYRKVAKAYKNIGPRQVPRKNTKDLLPRKHKLQSPKPLQAQQEAPKWAEDLEIKTKPPESAEDQKPCEESSQSAEVLAFRKRKAKSDEDLQPHGKKPKVAEDLNPELETPVYIESLKPYEDEFKKASLEFFNHWELSSLVVKGAFAKYFTPQNSRSQQRVSDPSVLYQKHIYAMSAVRRPDPSDVQGCNEYKLNLLLLTGICGSAVEILKMLENLERLYKTTNTPVPILDLGRSFKLPSLHSLQQEAHVDGVTVPQYVKETKKMLAAKPLGGAFPSFASSLDSVFGFDFESGLSSVFSFLGGFDTIFRLLKISQKVPRSLLPLLESLVNEHSILKAGLSNAYEKFRPFLAAQGIDGDTTPEQVHPVRLLYSGEVFDTNLAILSSPSRHIDNEGAEEAFQQLISSGAAFWTTDEVLSFVLFYHNENKRIPEELRNRRENCVKLIRERKMGSESDDLQSVARFLI
ncbi:hypothetical protein, conserved [Eimeria maxima]|uniref:Uncharacterized protein n=1 Tax=Eimeria maxima TaxID=5804 RepID=U6MBR8_EIMMA|nr:hypothetical protein, conserved [Eimeria maxima]CDJ61652.1 hypothetical protein, conserved [Eimeria maxima]